jgi:isopropylmalate/homocitrate/citramalate synthase
VTETTSLSVSMSATVTVLSTVELKYLVTVPRTVGDVMVTTVVLVATVEMVVFSNDEQYCDACARRARLPSNAED